MHIAKQRWPRIRCAMSTSAGFCIFLVSKSGTGVKNLWKNGPGFGEFLFSTVAGVSVPSSRWGFWGLVPTNKAPSLPKLKHETLYICWVFVNFQSVKPPRTSPKSPAETQGPPIENFLATLRSLCGFHKCHCLSINNKHCWISIESIVFVVWTSIGFSNLKKFWN